MGGGSDQWLGWGRWGSMVWGRWVMGGYEGCKPRIKGIDWGGGGGVRVDGNGELMLL